MTWSPQVCQALFAMNEQRVVSKAREAELVQLRKSLEGDLDRLGAGSSSEHLQVSREYVVTIRSIDYWRERQRTLSDKISEAISKAPQGQLFELDDVILRKPPTEADFFTKPEPVEDPTQPSLPMRKPKKTAPAADPPAEGVDQHLAASVNELDLRENIKGQLIDGGMPTIGAVAALLDKGGDLRELLECSENVERDIKKAVKLYRTAHRKAAREAEGGEA